MKFKTSRLARVSLLLILIGIVFVSQAAASELSMSSFKPDNSTNTNPIDGLGDGKPMMLEAILTIIGIYVASCILGIFGSGTTANFGNFLHNASLRKGGLGGIVLVIVVSVLVAVAVIYVFHIYNKYIGPGL